MTTLLLLGGPRFLSFNLLSFNLPSSFHLFYIFHNTLQERNDWPVHLDCASCLMTLLPHDSLLYRMGCLVVLGTVVIN
jgi:hypothetical protein